ncbi:LRR receptor-like serine/threonine-protein kinase GSO2 [Morella rubra]|uniref:LRR receptor-like serine/threonine-protein kinase GSO2 n=1 Tax=Morella rubra TaxID=262757 RepID=A0A6A1WBC5_9ROSI|nr:LRR receptor-like serine/threonine-protein kinase GSO2 [Morella rubra]
MSCPADSQRICLTSSQLTTALMEDNQLDGGLPSSLFECKQLQYLFLGYNKLTGRVPKEIRNLTSLTHLYLDFNNFQGRLPPEIGNLGMLKEIFLRNNSFEGRVPMEIGNLTMLTSLDLFDNHFEGSIPKTLGNLRLLQWLNLEVNKLTTEVSLFSDLSNCKYLRTVILSGNLLNSILPNSIGNLSSSLEQISLSECNIKGNIPISVGNLSNLIHLALEENELVGPLPSTIGRLRVLQSTSWKYEGSDTAGFINKSTIRWHPRDNRWPKKSSRLSLANNRLEGAIPESFGELVSLVVLELSNNSLSGEIPKSLEALSYLKYLNVSFNRLRGEVPMGGPFVNFSVASFMSNDALCGATRLQLPPCDTQAQKTTSKHMLKFILPTIGLTILALVLVLVLTRCNKSNARSTLVDAELSPLAQWRRISHQELIQATNGFSLNNLLGEGSFGSVYKGTLSDGMNIATKVLNLQVDGAFKSFDAECEHPSQFYWNLSSSLEQISLSECNIKGNIPISVGNLSNLIHLALEENELVGSLPSTIGRLRVLQRLALPDNRLDGPIPSELCHAKSLYELDLRGNKITGHIPTCINNLTLLRNLYLGNNQLSSTVPLNLWSLTDLLKIDLSSNSLTGSLSVKVGNMKVLTQLDLSTNQLSGGILGTIGGLKNLVGLSLANNRLEGAIPESFGELVSLVVLELSNNSLSGEIPKSLEALSYLKYLNVSFNRLRGEVPMGGPFVNFSVASFMSNDALCGATKLQLPPCDTQAQKTTSKHMLKFILPTIGLTILALVLVLVLTRCNKSNARSTLVDAELSPQAQWRRISHQELIQATNGFSLNNLLGEGSFGSVYKGTLSDGMNIATKYGSQGIVSTRGDMYSFGILLIETFTRKRPTDDMFIGEMSLKHWVNASLPHSVIDIIDPNLLRNERDDDAMKECISSLMGLAMGCCAESPEQRTNIVNVSAVLNKIKLKLLKDIGQN